jgi:hypothetical protein
VTELTTGAEEAHSLMVEIPTIRKRFNPAELTAWDHERLIPDVTLLELLSTAIEASAFRSCRTKSVNSAIQAKVFLLLFVAELIVIFFAVIIVSGNWATEYIEEVPLSGMDARGEKCARGSAPDPLCWWRYPIVLKTT